MWGICSGKDDSWETPPARAPASSQIIGLRVWVRIALSNRRSAELVSSPPVIATPIPHTHANSRDVLYFARNTGPLMPLKNAVIALNMFWLHKQHRTTRLLQQAWLVSGAFKNRQHAAWPALFRKAPTDLKALGTIICPAEWRPRHSVAEFLNKGVGYHPGLLLVR